MSASDPKQTLTISPKCQSIAAWFVYRRIITISAFFHFSSIWVMFGANDKRIFSDNDKVKLAARRVRRPSYLMISLFGFRLRGRYEVIDKSESEQK